MGLASAVKSNPQACPTNVVFKPIEVQKAVHTLLSRLPALPSPQFSSVLREFHTVYDGCVQLFTPFSPLNLSPLLNPLNCVFSF